MCVNQLGLVSETEGEDMTSQVGLHGGRSQLKPNQGFVKSKTVGENVLGRLPALSQILSSICLWKVVFLYTMAFMLIHVHGEEQTGICKLMYPAIIWDASAVVTDPEAMNICIPHGHINAENHSPDLLGPLIPFRNIKIMVVVLVFVGLAARMLYKRICWRAFTEADIDMGLSSEPAVPRRSDSTFEILPSID